MNHVFPSLSFERMNDDMISLLELLFLVPFNQHIQILYL
jgi:hypothetical protein